MHTQEFMNLENDFMKERGILKEKIKSEITDEMQKQIEYCLKKIEKLTDKKDELG